MALAELKIDQINLLLQRKFNPEYFQINELGIVPLQTRVRLQDDKKSYPLESYPDPKFLYDLVQIVDGIDSELNKQIHELVAKKIVSIKKSENEVGEIQSAFIRKLNRIDSYANQMDIGENIKFVFPLYGAVPIMDQVIQEGLIDRKKLIPVPIGGTIGVESGHTEIKDELNPEIIDKDNYIIFSDDVMDTALTAISLAIVRRRKSKYEDQELPPDDEYFSLISNIKKLRKVKKKYEDQELKQLYDKASQLMLEEKVIFAPLYCKNRSMINGLNFEAGQASLYDESFRWGVMQHEATRLDNTVIINEVEWIMGGMGGWGDKYNLLDTGFDGWEHEIENEDDFRGIMNDIKPEYRDFLIEKGLDRLYLRIGGGIKDLVVLFRDRYNDLARLTADWINAYIDKAIESGVYSIN